MGKKLVLKGDLTKEQFLKLYKKCTDVRMLKRYQAMYLSFTYEWEEIAEIIGVDYRTVMEWAKAYNREGLIGLFPDTSPGRKSGLTTKQLAGVKDAVTRSPRELGLRFSNWTTKSISAWIAGKFSVTLSGERVRQVLHEIGFSYVKPVHGYIRADGEERLKFVGDLRKAIEMGENMIFEDESSVDQHPTLHGMWVLKGTRKRVMTFGTHPKRHAFAATVPKTGEKFSRIAKRLTAAAFVCFLRTLLSKVSGEFTLVTTFTVWHEVP